MGSGSLALHHNYLERGVNSQVTGLHPDLLNQKSGVGLGIYILNKLPRDSCVHKGLRASPQGTASPPLPAPPALLPVPPSQVRPFLEILKLFPAPLCPKVLGGWRDQAWRHQAAARAGLGRPELRLVLMVLKFPRD